EDGIRDKLVTGVQTCALPICKRPSLFLNEWVFLNPAGSVRRDWHAIGSDELEGKASIDETESVDALGQFQQRAIGRLKFLDGDARAHVKRRLSGFGENDAVRLILILSKQLVVYLLFRGLP